MLENAVSNQFLVSSPQSSQHRLDKKKGVSGECSTSSETPIPFPKQSKPIKYDFFIYLIPHCIYIYYIYILTGYWFQIQTSNQTSAVQKSVSEKLEHQSNFRDCRRHVPERLRSWSVRHQKRRSGYGYLSYD